MHDLKVRAQPTLTSDCRFQTGLRSRSLFQVIRSGWPLFSLLAAVREKAGLAGPKFNLLHELLDALIVYVFNEFMCVHTSAFGGLRESHTLSLHLRARFFSKKEKKKKEKRKKKEKKRKTEEKKKEKEKKKACVTF